MKMGRDLCSSPPWVPFYPYTMFQNPILRPSCQTLRKTIITWKLLVIQSSNIVHCDWHTQKPICADMQAFLNTFPCVFFFIFCQDFRKQPKFYILLILTEKNASKWLEWHVVRVQGMSNPMWHVLSLCNKQFLKNQNFRQKFHILLILTGKIHWNGLSDVYLGFEVCSI